MHKCELDGCSKEQVVILDNLEITPNGASNVVSFEFESPVFVNLAVCTTHYHVILEGALVVVTLQDKKYFCASAKQSCLNIVKRGTMTVESEGCV